MRNYSKGRQANETQEKRENKSIFFKTKKLDKNNKSTNAAKKTEEIMKVSGLEIPTDWLKPQKFDDLLNFVKGILAHSTIDIKEFAEELEKTEIIAT